MDTGIIYTASTFCISCNIVYAVGLKQILIHNCIHLSLIHFIVVTLGPREWLKRAAVPRHQHRAVTIDS